MKMAGKYPLIYTKRKKIEEQPRRVGKSRKIFG
jgi:hypothetical protein